MHLAARNGDVASLAIALGSGGKVNELDDLRRTPLHLAAWAGKARNLLRRLRFLLNKVKNLPNFLENDY